MAPRLNAPPSAYEHTQPATSDSRRILGKCFADNPGHLLPENSIARLITKETIRRELPDQFRSPQLVDFIYVHAGKVFATTVFSQVRGNDLDASMETFQSHQFTDKKLPIGITLCGRAFSQVYEYEIHEDHLQISIPSHGGRVHVAIKELTNDAANRDAEQAWEQEANALDAIIDLKHSHLISRIAAFRRGEKMFFMFQWADGGSLRDFWQKHPKPNLDGDLIRDILVQLRGLASALSALHNYNARDERESLESYRHGDLKPENILRRPRTSTRYDTVRYEAPEAVIGLRQARPRRYDVWSMGCIIMEMIIWLLYGYDALIKFNAELKGDSSDEAGFYEKKEIDGQRTAEVHLAARKWMDQHVPGRGMHPKQRPWSTSRVS
ncbi:kinase-like protein [Zopfia rhizophila CBS 207.26]|uniref:Kinase-like protein n=1 Tax=Zopfia rhizophila CBS 207.26 TaxID=1314779 RepID=A0A6A6DXN1_9PEZI|nr:kinase-like protein [Zopfia rhizophila CBS 207.26]